jgi:hypothetical protein
MTKLAKLVLPALGFIAVTARADENLFGYVYGSDTLPKGKWEIYEWMTARVDKGVGDYLGMDFKTELEYGITDRFQASLYLNQRYHNIKGSAPLVDDGLGGSTPEYPNRNSFGFEGMQMSFKYNWKSVYKDGYGLSFYLEPGYSRIFKISGERQTEYELETKLIFQKNFLDDTLVWAVNWTTAPEWRRFEGADEYETELELEGTTGISYRVAPNWHVGLEMRGHMEVPKFKELEHFAVFLGPNLHYGGQHWWATLTFLPQVVGGPTHDDLNPNRLSGRHSFEHEAVEVRLKVGYNF